MPRMTPEEAAHAQAERLLGQLAETFAVEGMKPFVGMLEVVLVSPEARAAVIQYLALPTIDTTELQKLLVRTLDPGLRKTLGILGVALAFHQLKYGGALHRLDELRHAHPSVG